MRVKLRYEPEGNVALEALDRECVELRPDNKKTQIELFARQIIPAHGGETPQPEYDGAYTITEDN